MLIRKDSGSISKINDYTQRDMTTPKFSEETEIQPCLEIEFFVGTGVVSASPVIRNIGNSALAFSDIFPRISLNSGNRIITIFFRIHKHVESLIIIDFASYYNSL